jgi:DNA-binding winged helix-turn-helix (wHTH) protein
MSIEAAAKELTKEIERLQKEAERLTKLRDALSSGSAEPAATIVRRGYKKAPAKKTSIKVSPTAKKVATKTVPPAKKKRVMSPEGRKAIADATWRRWALKKKADASAEK